VAKNVKPTLARLLPGLDCITPAVFTSLLAATGATPSYLRHLLRDSDVPLHPLVEGVRQSPPADLIRTLSALSVEYDTQPTPARNLVLESKRHCLLNLRRHPDDVERRHVLIHLNVWLENPPLYPLWARLENKNAAEPRGTAASF
jgi:hypothetical protein